MISTRGNFLPLVAKAMIKENLIILTTTNCPGCEALKKQVGKRIPVYDVQTSEDAVELVMKEGVMAVPTVMHKDSNGNWNKCQLSFDKGKVLIKCKNKNIELERK